MADLEDLVELHGGEKAHPFVAHTEGGGVGVTLHMCNVSVFLVDLDTVVVVAHELGLGVHQDAELEPHADFPGVLDAEAELQGHVDVVAVHLVAFEAVHIAVLGELQRVGGIGIQDTAVGEVVMAGIAHAEAHRVALAFPEGEIVGEGGAEALAEQPDIPVGAGVELEVVENVEAQGDLLVRLVGDQLGESAGAEDQGDEGNEYFFHKSGFVVSLGTTKIGINLNSVTNSLKFGGVCRAGRRFPRH